MEHEATCLVDYSYFCHGKSTQELTESLLLTTMELEAAQEEVRLRDDELIQLRQLLNKAIHERDEAQNRYQALLQTTTPPPPQYSTISSIEDELVTNGTAFSSSDCEESIASSPLRFTPSDQEFPFPTKALPEKGKLLESVIKAGPLLQNLLLAGPLPQWRHPPPPLDTYQIPPPIILNRKRGSDSTKYQRIGIN